MYRIGILGTGGWGTALTVPLAQNGHLVKLWSFENDVCDEINQSHTNNNYLPGITIPGTVTAFTDYQSLADSDVLVIAVPTQFIRSVVKGAAGIFKGKPVVNVAKGIERNTLMRVSEILFDSGAVTSDSYVTLTGPSHAEEVARLLPTTVVAASSNHSLSEKIQNLFSTPRFRVYSSDDVTGCELGGAVKNIIAIAAGIIDGLGLGDNTKAALITRGLAEMSRLGIALGANPLTYSGLSGLGDLIVTCNSRHSRNRRVGEQIGKGVKPSDFLADTRMIAEGVHTTESTFQLAAKCNVEMPIVEQMYDIIFKGKDPMDAITELMTRSSKREWW